MKTLLISLALVLALSGVAGGQNGGLQAFINQWCAENPPFIQGKTFTVMGRRGDFDKIVNDFLDKHPDYWFGGASEKELYNKPKPGQPYPTEWRYDPRNILEFVFYPINPDNPLKENGCYERWKANSPDYPKTIGNTSAKEFRDLVVGWCVKNPPETCPPCSGVRDRLMEKLKKCSENMAANAEMYRKLLTNNSLSDYSRIECKAKAEAWQEASEMLANIDNPWDRFGWERP